MRYLRSAFGVCAFSMIMATTAFGHSPEYRAGRAAAYIDYCGKYDLNRALYNKYGKSKDYESGKSDTEFQNMGLPSRGNSHKINHIACDQLEGFTKILLNASAQSSNINKAYNTPFICRMAFNYATGRWMEPSNGVYWYSYEVRGEFVNRAKRQGLSEQDCIRILGIEDLVKVARAKRDQKAARLAKRDEQRLEEEVKRERDRLAAVELERLKELERKRKEEQKRRAKELAQQETKRKEIANAQRLAEIEKNRERIKAEKYETAKLKHQDAIALIIGNRDYKGDTPDVEFAVNDADAMRDFVLSKLGYRSGNIIDLRDATQAELLSAFGSKESHKGTLFDYVRADESDVIVFYSGHGVPGLSDRRGYLLSVDANPNKAELTGYPVETLLKNLSKIPAKSMMVFIDACFSGNTPKGMLVDAMSGLTVEIRQPKKASKGMVVLTASRGDQVASWDKNAKHGLFTKHLLEALNGAADKQSKTGNNDGKVTLGEVKAYLDREMTYQARRRFSRDQHATVSGDLKTVLSAY
ncbi:caspase family protein [Alphaproteobacteria bacterium]|nr:caspase family protein [Alphaproteobacteria bacterium]